MIKDGAGIGGQMRSYTLPWMNTPQSIIEDRPSINIDMDFNGVTSEKLMKELPNTIKTAVDTGINDYNNKRNNTAKALGITGRNKW